MIDTPSRKPGDRVRRGRCYDARVTPLRPRWLLRALVLAVVFASCAQSSSSVAASVGDSEISIDRLQADVDLYGFLTAISGAPCGTPVQGETDESACARTRKPLAPGSAASCSTSLASTSARCSG